MVNINETFSGIMRTSELSDESRIRKTSENAKKKKRPNKKSTIDYSHSIVQYKYNANIPSPGVLAGELIRSTGAKLSTHCWRVYA